MWFLMGPSAEFTMSLLDEDKLYRESDSRWHTYIGNVHEVPQGPEGRMCA